MNSYKDVLNFWFLEIDSRLWFAKDRDFDELLKKKFLSLHTQVRQGEAFHWRQFPAGRLAEIIVLDQFSRNIFRNSSDAFRYDSMALVLAQEAVAAKADQLLSLVQRSFLYMPYMHSESAIIHQEAIKLFSTPGLEYNLDYELQHKKIIDHFGRYPHRNQILGRNSTSEELEYLSQPGVGF